MIDSFYPFPPLVGQTLTQSSRLRSSLFDVLGLLPDVFTISCGKDTRVPNQETNHGNRLGIH